MVMADGFNYLAKPNSQAWPYPCPRPLFRTSWLFRTASMTSLHAVAMQLRILWMSVKWDDLSTKPPALYDGKNQVTTDNEIVTTEILKHRNIGRYMETTQYWQRKISIPLDAPRKQVDYSPIRSGLRKRKRAESPVSADPRVQEVWVDELNLELWEIRAYRERLDRERERLTTRRQAGTVIKAPEKFDPSEDKKKIFNQSLQDIKQRTEESLRQQREAFKAGKTVPEVRSNVGNIIRTSGGQGGVKLIASKNDVSAGNAAKKIFITKDGKIIGHQLAAPPGKVPIPNLTPTKQPTGNMTGPPAATPSPAAPVQQKVQIVKSADGKVQVRGLLPGQQLVQMPDGRLQIFSNQPVVSGANVVPPAKPPEPSPSVPSVIQSTQSPGVKLITQQPQPQPQVQQQQPQPMAQPQQLLPKPNPVGVVQSPAKTYTIQKNPNALPPNTPIQPKPVPQPAVTPTVNSSPSVTGATPTNSKQKVIGIKSLGNNTVTIKDGQLIVQGPDHEEATAVAKQLASGQAKLGNVAGKQVLVMLQQEEPAPPPVPVEPPKPPKPPTPPPPQPPPVVQQPPATVNSVTVTAQLIQTAQGPRIVLQGLQGVQLEQQQLAQIQQQVKTQLLKQQAIARQQGKVPPTKVSIQLTGSFTKAPQDQPQPAAPVQQPQQQQPQQVVGNDVGGFEPPQLAVQPQQLPQVQPQQQQQLPQQSSQINTNSFLSNEPQVILS